MFTLNDFFNKIKMHAFSVLERILITCIIALLLAHVTTFKIFKPFTSTFTSHQKKWTYDSPLSHKITPLVSMKHKSLSHHNTSHVFQKLKTKFDTNLLNISTSHT